MRTQPGCVGEFTQTLESWLSAEMLIGVIPCLGIYSALLLHFACMNQEKIREE